MSIHQEVEAPALTITIIPKKMMMVTPVLDPHHAFRGFVLAWIHTLAKKFREMVIVTAYAAEFAPPENVKVYAVRKVKDEHHWTRIMLGLSIMRHLWRDNIDVVFAHMSPMFVIFAAPVAKLRKIPIIFWYAHRSIYKRLKIAHWFCDYVITASEESFRIESPKRVIIGHGIDTDIFVPRKITAPRQEFRILSVSRIAHTKRCHLIIDAFSRFKKSSPHIAARLILIGHIAYPADRWYLDQLQKQVMELGVKDSVDFKGKVSYPDTVFYYQSCDLFMNTSDTGSLDKAVLEAMACEKLILTTNEAFERILTPVMPDMYLRKDAGSEALARRIQDCLSLPESKKKAVGAQLRQIVVLNHSLQQLPEKIASLIEKIDGKNHR